MRKLNLRTRYFISMHFEYQTHEIETKGILCNAKLDDKNTYLTTDLMMGCCLGIKSGELRSKVNYVDGGEGKDGDKFLYPPIQPFKTGFLDVSKVHSIYYEQVGNPGGLPVLYVHG
jgi:hypothetical protein